MTSQRQQVQRVALVVGIFVVAQVIALVAVHHLSKAWLLLLLLPIAAISAWQGYSALHTPSSKAASEQRQAPSTWAIVVIAVAVLAATVMGFVLDRH